MRSIFTLLFVNRGSFATILKAVSSAVTNSIGAEGRIVRISTAASIPLADFGWFARFSDGKVYSENLEYLEHNRIEIDSIQRVVGYQKLWAFIIKKLQERFPERNYSRAIRVAQMVFPDIYLDLEKLLLDKIKPERNILAEEMYLSFEQYEGIMDDINDDEIAILRYFTMEINNSSSLKDIIDKIKELLEELRRQN